MLMAELSTAVQHQLPIKIIVLKNNSPSEVRFERVPSPTPMIVHVRFIRSPL